MTGKVHTRQQKPCYIGNLTLTFKDPTPHKLGLYKLCIEMLNQKTFIDYAFYPEYGENANFHIHGTIWYTNKVHYCSFINIWRRKYGFTYESKLKKETRYPQLGWLIYCMKNQSEWHRYRITKYNIKNRYKKLSISIIGKHGYKDVNKRQSNLFDIMMMAEKRAPSEAKFQLRLK